MAVTVNGHTLMAASSAVVRALLDNLTDKKYRGGVLGVQASPEWDGPEEFTHHGHTVRVAACPSTLTVWEALRDKGQADWLVLLTPCSRDDLGGGVLAHLVGNRLRTPDPWQAVQQRFSAEQLDPRLYTAGEKPRELATGLLAAISDDSFVPAPGGVLTRDHALGCVARGELDLVEDGAEVDVTTIMAWSAQQHATAQLGQLRKSGGDALADEAIDWLAEHCGLAAHPVRTLLRGGRVADIVPLGIIAGLLDSPELSAGHAAGQFAGTYGLGRLSTDALAAWNAEAAGLATTWLAPELARKVLHAASTRVTELGLTELARQSDLLPTGLQTRLAELAQAISRLMPAEGAAEPSEPDSPLVTGDLTVVEDALTRVREHHLAGDDETVPAFESAVRLLRWLSIDTATPEAERGALNALVRRQVSTDAWVDAAVNDVARGSGESSLAHALGQVLGLVRTRRDAHDREFGGALTQAAENVGSGVERVLPDLVLPLAERRPTLLLVLDGLSMAIATRLVEDAGRTGWGEYAFPAAHGRTAALATLPTLTEFSRCSLLCGELRHGGDDVETQGFADQLNHARLGAQVPGSTKKAPLFHKKDLDTSEAGHSLSSDVQSAIADTEQFKLVGAVLNAVDDALHHTDPAGIEWDLDAVTHLKPLLEAARRAGRTVVLTSDHGHVIERRAGQLHQHSATHGARARVEMEGAPPTGDEVVARGSRVLTATGSAVLAVNERVRYGPLNAGYHGGGSPAEVVVPVLALHAGHAPTDTALEDLPDQRPAWWEGPLRSSTAPQTPTAAAEPDALFELTPAAPAPASVTATDATAPQAEKLAKAVLASKAFQGQRANVGRLPMHENRIAALLTALLSTPERRVSAREASSALEVNAPRLRGALSLLKRLFDIEGYVVLSYEPESGDVVLDEATLREQFGVTG